MTIIKNCRLDLTNYIRVGDRESAYYYDDLIANNVDFDRTAVVSTNIDRDIEEYFVILYKSISRVHNNLEIVNSSGIRTIIIDVPHKCTKRLINISNNDFADFTLKYIIGDTNKKKEKYIFNFVNNNLDNLTLNFSNRNFHFDVDCSDDECDSDHFLIEGNVIITSTIFQPQYIVPEKVFKNNKMDHLVLKFTSSLLDGSIETITNIKQIIKSLVNDNIIQTVTLEFVARDLDDRLFEFIDSYDSSYLNENIDELFIGLFNIPTNESKEGEDV